MTPDEHLGHISRQSAKAYITDHLGSVLNSEIASEKQIYGAFGETFTRSALTPQSEPVSYGFTGRQFDPESGNYYYRARSYAPRIGRFTSRDPIGFRGGSTNLYSYALNASVNLTDSSGLAPGDIFQTPAGAAGDFFNYVNSTSIALNREFASWIFQVPGGYTYTNPVMGSPAGSNPGEPPRGYQSVIHTHGAYDPNYANEFFSPADVNFAQGYGIDI